MDDRQVNLGWQPQAKLGDGFFQSQERKRLVINRKPTKNYTKLCKTKPILKSYQCPQTLLQKQLTKIFAIFVNQKTKPIQSQTKPILSAGGGFHLEAKMDANYFVQRDYGKILAFFRRKNKANSNPISKTSKNERKLRIQKGL